jgi:hypothetical protein
MLLWLSPHPSSTKQFLIHVKSTLWSPFCLPEKFSWDRHPAVNTEGKKYHMGTLRKIWTNKPSKIPPLY